MDWRMPLCSVVLPDAKLLKIKGEVPWRHSAWLAIFIQPFILPAAVRPAILPKCRASGTALQPTRIWFRGYRRWFHLQQTDRGWTLPLLLITWAFFIDLNAAHGVVNRRSHKRRIVRAAPRQARWSSIQVGRPISSPVPTLVEFIPLLNSPRLSSYHWSRLLSQFFKRIGFEGFCRKKECLRL